MTVKLRLARGGSKKRPFYRIVAADVRSPRDGRYIEKLGHHDPLLPKGHSERYRINDERIRYWLGTGAQPTQRMERLLVEAGLMEASPISEQTKQHLPKAKAQERAKAEAEKANASAPEAAPEAEAAPAEEAEVEAAPAEEAVAEAPAEEAAPAEAEAEAPAEEAAPAEETQAEETQVEKTPVEAEAEESKE